ncbi:MAG: hypothetical protein ACOYL6_15705 [Bacteriovoracaceae bacterium]
MKKIFLATLSIFLSLPQISQASTFFASENKDLVLKMTIDNNTGNVHLKASCDENCSLSAVDKEIVKRFDRELSAKEFEALLKKSQETIKDYDFKQSIVIGGAIGVFVAVAIPSIKNQLVDDLFSLKYSEKCNDIFTAPLFIIKRAWPFAVGAPAFGLGIYFLFDSFQEVSSEDINSLNLFAQSFQTNKEEEVFIMPAESVHHMIDILDKLLSQN